MSHYKIAVITTPTSPSIDTLLAPYSEYLEVAPYVALTHAEAIAAAHDCIVHAKQNPNEKWAKHVLDATENLNDEELFNWYLQYNYTSNHPVNENGDILTTYNPDSKYDYYTELDELTVDEWYHYDLDEYDNEIDFYEEWEQRSKHGDGWYNEKYYLEKYGDADTYVRYQKLPYGYAIVTPDGHWHAPGVVGWFATDNMTPESIRLYLEWFEVFKEQLDPNSTVTIVDCHI